MCLILDDCETLGGIQLTTLDTAEILRKAGYQVTMVCRRLGRWVLEKLARELAGVRIVERRPYGVATVDMVIDYVQASLTSAGSP